MTAGTSSYGTPPCPPSQELWLRWTQEEEDTNKEGQPRVDRKREKAAPWNQDQPAKGELKSVDPIPPPTPPPGQPLEVQVLGPSVSPGQGHHTPSQCETTVSGSPQNSLPRLSAWKRESLLCRSAPDGLHLSLSINRASPGQ